MDIVQRQETLKAFKSLPPGELDSLIFKSSQHLRDLNLTHRGMEMAPESPILLDPLPLVVNPEEVPFLQKSVDQWGRLLTMVYQDLWGPQELLKSGVLDHRLVWEELKYDPAFSQALPKDWSPLSLIRFDLSRSPEGFWTLGSLGTGIPQGLGYAIENRIVHSRFFGSRVPHGNLVRLAPFLQGLKDLWNRTSPSHKEDPSIMVWTSGPRDPYYFEPVYLSRYFGYPLVESRDLTVRSGKVFLKTLGGLQPVDVLIRMVGDHQIDPLCGNPGGLGGVAGLMHAIRDRSVLVTNAPGSGILEHPALLSQYPDLCSRLLGEDLTLVPKMFPGSPNPGREDFYRQGQWQPAPVSIRFFAALLGKNWELMPGGLVQETPEAPSASFSEDPLGFRGTKKDLWFLSSHLVPTVSLLPTGEKPMEINRAADLPSRVADDLFWLGRYTERAWIDLRFMEKWWECHFEGGPEHHSEAKSIISSLVRDLEIMPGSLEGQEEVWKRSRLHETLGEINRVAGQVLDRLSLETHRILKEFGQFINPLPSGALPETLRQINLRLAAFSGLTMESMTRSMGWRFLDMGRRLERAGLVIESLESFFAQEDDDENLRILLEMFDSTLTYSTRYRLAPQRGPVLDLLLLDEGNPRSLAFQVESLSRHVNELPKGNLRAYRTLEERTILGLLTKLRLCDASTLTPGLLEPFLEEVSKDLDKLSLELHQTYLAKIDSAESIQLKGRMEWE